MAGYFEFSKSNNAVVAEHSGLFPASKIAKLLKVSSQAVKTLLFPQEWHHTSKYYNVTDYYSLDEAREKIDELKSLTFPVQEKIYEGCFGSYLQWGGTRNHPVAKEIKFSDVKVVVKGNWCHIFMKDAKVKKALTTKGFDLHFGKLVDKY